MPKADHQGSIIPFTDFRWIGPYIVEKALPNNNYLVQKLGTNKTQVLYRMRLRLLKPTTTHTRRTTNATVKEARH